MKSILYKFSKSEDVPAPPPITIGTLICSLKFFINSISNPEPVPSFKIEYKISLLHLYHALFCPIQWIEISTISPIVIKNII